MSAVIKCCHIPNTVMHFFLGCLFINKKERTSIPSKQWLVFMHEAKIRNGEENKPEMKLKIQLVWQGKQHRHAPYGICFK